MLLIQGVVLVIWVTNKYGLPLEPWARAVKLMLHGWGGLIRSLIGPARRGAARKGPGMEVCSEPRVQKSVLHLMVFPGCCLPHYLQLFLHIPEDRTKNVNGQGLCYYSTCKCEQWRLNNSWFTAQRGCRHEVHSCVTVATSSCWSWQQEELLSLEPRGSKVKIVPISCLHTTLNQCWVIYWFLLYSCLPSLTLQQTMESRGHWLQ